MTGFLAGVAVGAVLCLAWQAWRFADLTERLAVSERRHDAYRAADTRTDLDQVGAVTQGVRVLPQVTAPQDELPPPAAVVPGLHARRQESGPAMYVQTEEETL